jgi:hypothetical protein
MTTKTTTAADKKRDAAIEAAIDKLEAEGLPTTVRNVCSITGASYRGIQGPIRAIKAGSR